MKRDVQLIDLRDVSTVFAAQIVGNNELLFSKDENIRIAYDIRAFKDYVKLNEGRQVVLDAIKREGMTWEYCCSQLSKVKLKGN